MLKKYFKNTTIIAFSELLQRVKALVLMPILTNFFGTVNYGIWAQVNVVITLIVPLINWGTVSAAMRYLPNADIVEKRDGLATLFIQQIGLGFFFSFLLFWGNQFISQAFFGDKKYFAYITLCAFYIFTRMFLLTFRYWYKIHDKAFLLVLIDIILSFGCAAIALWVAFNNYSLYFLLVATLYLEIFLCFFLFLDVLGNTGIGIPSYKIFKKFFLYGVGVMPASYASIIVNVSDRIFITHFCGLGSLGVYNVAYHIGQLFPPTFIKPFQEMYMPRASELFDCNQLKDLQILFLYNMKASQMFFIPAVFGFTILSDTVMRYLSTEEFLWGKYIITIVAISYGFYFFGSFYGVHLALLNKQYIGTLNLFIAAIINTIFNIIFIPFYGIYGAAISTLLSFFVKLLLDVIIAQKLLPISIDFCFLFKVFVSTFFMCVFVMILPHITFISAILSSVLGAIFYFLLLYFMNAFSIEEKKYFLNLFSFKSIMK